MTLGEVRIARTFSAWLAKNGSRLLRLPSDEAADEIGDFIVALDSRLGVEVGNSKPAQGEAEARELIITAFSNREAFPLVRQIVDSSIATSGWRVVALKPPRGFDFVVTVGDSELQANDLTFIADPVKAHVIRLVAEPSALAAVSPDDALEIGWLVVETGLGEELSSRIAALDLISSNESNQPGESISELAEYVRSFQMA
jgi:hypothetical protein